MLLLTNLGILGDKKLQNSHKHHFKCNLESLKKLDLNNKIVFLLY
jgi:hypothetical protein